MQEHTKEEKIKLKKKENVHKIRKKIHSLQRRHSPSYPDLIIIIQKDRKKSILLKKGPKKKYRNEKKSSITLFTFHFQLNSSPFLFI